MSSSIWGIRTGLLEDQAGMTEQQCCTPRTTALWSCFMLGINRISRRKDRYVQIKITLFYIKEVLNIVWLLD